MFWLTIHPTYPGKTARSIEWQRYSRVSRSSMVIESQRHVIQRMHHMTSDRPADFPRSSSYLGYLDDLFQRQSSRTASHPERETALGNLPKLSFDVPNRDVLLPLRLVSVMSAIAWMVAHKRESDSLRLTRLEERLGVPSEMFGRLISLGRRIAQVLVHFQPLFKHEPTHKLNYFRSFKLAGVRHVHICRVLWVQSASVALDHLSAYHNIVQPQHAFIFLVSLLHRIRRNLIGLFQHQLGDLERSVAKPKPKFKPRGYPPLVKPLVVYGQTFGEDGAGVYVRGLRRFNGTLKV